MIIAPPLSALAARRLRSQEATPPEPKTPENKKKAIKTSSTSKNTSPRPSATATAANSESENVEDLATKRREIEKQLKDQLRAQAQARPALGYDGAGTEESALSRVRRKSGEITSVTVTPTDDEMVDVSELVELRSEGEDREGELQAQVNLSYNGERYTAPDPTSPKNSTRHADSFGTCGKAQSRSLPKSQVSYQPNTTTAHPQTMDTRPFV